MGKSSSKPDIPSKSLLLYKNYAWERKIVKKLIVEKRLAPFYPGLQEAPAGSVLEQPISSFLEECPICFLLYPVVNRSNCCNQPICTECYLQIKPFPSMPAVCPYCNCTTYSASYKGPMSKDKRLKEEEEQQKVLDLLFKMKMDEIQREKEREEAKKKKSEEEKQKDSPPRKEKEKEKEISISDLKKKVAGWRMEPTKAHPYADEGTVEEASTSSFQVEDGSSAIAVLERSPVPPTYYYEESDLSSRCDKESENRSTHQSQQDEESDASSLKKSNWIIKTRPKDRNDSKNLQNKRTSTATPDPTTQTVIKTTQQTTLPRTEERHSGHKQNPEHDKQIEKATPGEVPEKQTRNKTERSHDEMKRKYQHSSRHARSEVNVLSTSQQNPQHHSQHKGDNTEKLTLSATLRQSHPSILELMSQKS